MVFEYKYDYELSTKRQIFLWLYQVLPNIDIIKHIYQLKEDFELEEIKSYYGVCPHNIITNSTWSKDNINMCGSMKLSTTLMKYIVEPGFICKCSFNSDDYDPIELEEINNGNWISVIPNIDFNPRLITKIKVINETYNNTPLCNLYLFKTIKKIYKYYKCTYGINIFRLCIMNDNLVINNFNIN
jgi:hypothetical protein